MKKKCKICGKEFDSFPSSVRKFCSRECYYEFEKDRPKNLTDKQRIKRSQKVKELHQKGIFKENYFEKGENNPGYGKNQTGEKNNNWKGGFNDGYYRRLAFENLSHACNICGGKEGRLIVHHKDLMGACFLCQESLNDLMNNRINNLEILCPTCHNKLHRKLEKSSILVLVSGGIDSITTLHWAYKFFKNVVALSFDYGQRSSEKELSCARYNTDSLNIKHLFSKTDIFKEIGGTSLLKISKQEIPLERQIEEITSGIPSTYVPARNLIFLNIAGAIAQIRGISNIAIGVNYIDATGYPDTSPQFISSIQEALRCGLANSSLNIFTPLLYLTKSQIIRLGLYLGVNFSHTWSCYKNNGKACGKCDSCKLRLKGFEEINLKDPIEYE